MRMNHHLVPDFGVEDEYCIPTPSGFSRPTKPSMAGEELMELLWQNGQVVMQGQNQINQKKSLSPQSQAVDGDNEQLTSREIRSFSTAAPQPDDASATNLFIQEDEMTSWLYPLEDTSLDHDFCADYFYSSAAPPPTGTAATTAALVAAVELRPPLMPISTKPPISPVKVSTDVNHSSLFNFGHFSRMQGRDETGPSVSKKAVRESTIVGSCDAPVTGQDSRVAQSVRETGEINNIGGCGSVRCADVVTTSSTGGEMAMSPASSSGGSGCVSVSAEPTQKTPLNEDRKRKVREATNNTDYCSEYVQFEPADPKKEVHGSAPAKRSRAAEVHNLSERRRRDRINEKMKALQELIPRCNKSDKASMLDEAIEYMKSLQLQVQMMSMGCSMVPMMFPGMQQYMVPLGMGMRMGMDMSMSRPMMSFPPVLASSAMPTPSAAAHMDPRYPIPGYDTQPVPPSDSSRIQANYQPNPMLNPFATQSHNQQQLPFPPVLAGSAMPTPSAAAHMGPRYPIPGYHMQPVPPSDSSRIQAKHQPNPKLNPLPTQSHNQQQLPFINPYPRCYGLRQMQSLIPKNQATAKQSTSKPSTNCGAEKREHPQSG